MLRTIVNIMSVSLCAIFQISWAHDVFSYSSDSVLNILCMFYQDLSSIHQMIVSFSSEQGFLVITLLPPNQARTDGRVC